MNPETFSPSEVDMLPLSRERGTYKTVNARLPLLDSGHAWRPHAWCGLTSTTPEPWEWLQDSSVQRQAAP